MKQTLIIAIAFVGVFFSGAVVGGMVTFRWGGQMRHEKAIDQYAAQNLKQLAEVLELTAEQRQKLRPVIIEGGKELAGQRRQNQANLAQVAERLDVRIRAHLTDEQRLRLDEFRAKRRDRDKKWNDYVRALRAQRGNEPPPVPEKTPKIED